MNLVEGDPKSSVRVVSYEDLQCPDSAAYRRMMDDQLLPKFGSQAAFEHRDFPLPEHDWARRAAVASRFFQASDPVLAVAFRKMVMGNQAAINAENFDARLRAFAKTHGIDSNKAIAALEDSALAKLVEEDYREGVARGVSKTPTVFVNEKSFVEHFEFNAIAKAIQSG